MTPSSNSLRMDSVRSLHSPAIPEAMTDHTPPLPASASTTRREFLARGGAAVAASALAGVALPPVHAAGGETVQLAIIGSGNRGSGAIVNAMEATGSTTKLVAMADLY
jgi:hypothetical protein